VVHPDSVTSEFRRVQNRLDLPRIRLHDARHTWATLALKMGVPLKVVSANLGHSSITVTADIYSHVTPTMAADATAQIASSIFSAT
jgi:integrase